MAIVEAVESVNGERRRLRLSSPLTGAPIGEIAVSTAAEVRDAVARARRAQPAWEARGLAGRAAIMRRAIQTLLKDQEEYIEVIRRETGRSRF